MDTVSFHQLLTVLTGLTNFPFLACRSVDSTGVEVLKRPDLTNLPA